MEPAHEIPSLELLLAQEGWVRALARRLVSRESEAEDVAQSALAVALERPPRSGENAPVLRAWLAQVARRLVIGAQRTDSRRVERERRVARAEALPSASEIHAQEEERRIVVEALLGLSEPFRTTLLLRYYRGLEPIEIARTTDVPDSTVRNRLARGLAQLKQRLEARQGADWRASCALLAGPLAPASKGVLIGKGVVMGVNLKMAISCSVVALAGLAWWGLHGNGAAGPKPAQLEVASVQRLSNETEKPAEDASNSVATRAKVEQPPSTPSATALAANDPVGILVYGAVRERDGGRTHGKAWVRLLSSEGRELSSAADEQGAFAFTGLSAGNWKLSASLTGYREQSVNLQLDGSQSVRRVDLTLEGRLRIPVRFQTPDGRRLRDALREKKPTEMILEISLGALATEHELPPTIPARTLDRFEHSNLGEYYPVEGGEYVGSPPISKEDDGTLVVEDRFPMFISATWRGVVFESRRCETAPAELVFTLEPERVLRSIGGFRVQVLDAVDHSPLKASYFQLVLRNYTAMMGAQPREDGVIECAQLPPGMLQLSLACAGHEQLLELIEIEPGTVRDLGSRELARTIGCEIQVVDASGRPLGGVSFLCSGSSDGAVERPFEPSSAIESDSKGLLKCRCGPSQVWVIPRDRKWTAEPLLLAGASAQRIVMQPGSELVAVFSATVPQDATLVVRDRNDRSVVVEEARPGFLARSRLLPGHYDVALVTFDTTILKKSIDLGDKPLVIDLAP